MGSSKHKGLLKQAISFAINDSWEASHNIVQDIDSLEAYWIHAVLHKIEGDESNSRYWYERAHQSYDAYSNPKEELIFIQNNL
jgi:hypothetical protein